MRTHLRFAIDEGSSVAHRRRMDNGVRTSLREAYGRKAVERDGYPLAPWKLECRGRFVEQLRQEGKHSLLELGAGAGKDGEFFVAQGLRVLCTDLCPEMIALCQQKGLDARVMDLVHLDVPSESFDAAYALNCLLHVPDHELSTALEAIRAALKPGGLFYTGVWGGRDQEGIWEGDDYEPKRFFALRTDARLLERASQTFEVIAFERLVPGSVDGLHFQSLLLRKSSHAA